MSWWIYRTGKGGRRELWAIDIDIILVIVLLGLGPAFLGPQALQNPRGVAALSLLFVLVGLGCVAWAKTSLFRQGIWIAWGSGRMTKGYATLYKVGYVLVGIGLALLGFVARVHG